MRKNLELITWLDKNKAFQTGNSFTSKSGKSFNYETDLRYCYLSQFNAIKTTKMILNSLEMDLNTFDYFMGVPETGTLMALFLNYQKYLMTNVDFPINMLRSHHKEYQGSTNSIHTVLPLSTSNRVCVIEDDVVTGATLIKCLRQVKDLGFDVIHVVSVIDRQLLDEQNVSVKEKIETEFKTDYHALVTLSEIKDFMVKEISSYEI